MPVIARVGDRTDGTCSSHTVPIQTGGTIVAGAGKSTCEGKPIARIGDMVQLDCGHVSEITSGSSTVTCEGKGVARIGDKVQKSPYNGVIISGAGTSSSS